MFSRWLFLIAPAARLRLPVFGLHLYTWCFIAFSSQIAASAVLLIMTVWLEDSKVRGLATRITAAAFAFIVAANFFR